LASDDAPLPLSATFDVATRETIVTFDRPLAPPLLDASNWKLDRAANEYPPTAAPVVAGSTVTFTASGFGGSGPPGNNVRYAATPPDLVGLTGAPVAAFTLPYVDI
jgi:hypothetical protein